MNPALATPSVFATASNQFTIDLYKAAILPKPASENAFLSPFCVLAALSMVSTGAKGLTRDEMLKTLRLNTSASVGAAGDAYKDLVNRFRDPEQETQKHSSDKFHIQVQLVSTSGEAPAPVLKIADRVYVQKGLKIKPTFQQSLSKNFASTFGAVDFRNHPDAATKEINDWVSKVTNGKISQLFAEKLDSSALMVLVSAIYFKAPWQDAFEEYRTRDMPFFASGKNSVSTKFMGQVDDKNSIADFPDLDAAVLLKPYANKDFHMLFILPNKKDGLANLEKRLSVDVFDVSRYSSGRDIAASIPKFKMEDSYSLPDVLKKMGMKKAFTQADFSGITADAPLVIGDVLHKTFVSLDENGTEAAAVTAVEMVEGDAMTDETPPPPRVFNADHPFLFAIQHRQTGTVLFLGRIENPAK